MPAWAVRIRAERRRRLWDVHTMARRLRQAAGEERRFLPDHDSLVRSIRRWESGRIGVLSERYRLLYCRAFGLPEHAVFGGAPEHAGPGGPPGQIGSGDRSEHAGSGGTPEHAAFGGAPPAEPAVLRLLITPDLLPLLRDPARDTARRAPADSPTP